MIIDSERWLPVPGYEDLYEVSDLGRVRSFHRWGDGKRGDLRKLVTQKSSGHLQIALSGKDGRKKTFRVHQLVLLAFAGPCPDGLETLHGDGNPANNVLTNLRYGTRAENHQDRLRHGDNHNAAKTHCIRGHEFTPENTYIQNHGKRGCRACLQVRNDARPRKTTRTYKVREGAVA